MQDPLLVIRTMYTSFSAAEKQIADYFISHSAQVPYQSVYEVAELCRTSTATVSRFVKKIGYTAFSEFKVEMMGEAQRDGREFYRDIRDDDSEDEMIRKIFLGNIKSLEDTLKLIDPGLLTEAVKKICGSSKLSFFGIGSSGNIARDAAMRFSLLGFNAQAHTDPTEIIFHASTAGKKDAVFGLSHSGRSVIPVKGCSLARERGAVTIGIANYRGSPLEETSDYFFCTSFPEQRVKIAAVTSRTAQMCIIDAMYLLSTKYRKTEIDYAAVNAVTDEILRL